MTKKQLAQMFPTQYKRYQMIKNTCFYLVKKHSGLKTRKKILAKEYYRILGLKLNLDSPTRYTEKIQWFKLFGVDKTISLLTDKYYVRNWIKEKIGEEYLIPLISIAEKYTDINFDSLPQSFVIKSNASSGWNIIVKDKNSIDVAAIKKKMVRRFGAY